MKIALTYTGSDEKHNNYVRWLKANDDITVIKISADDNNLEEVKNCDALVLSGGVDIHPEFYNQYTDYANAPQVFNKERDHLEFAVFQSALENGKPVLGICRGLQLVNCFFGGSLEQDLGNDLNKIHRSEKKDKAHGLTVESGTVLHKIIQAERGVVNSAHHQAIKILGEGLKVNCVADDGTIEGFEWANASDKPFLLCIQWHPERMFQFGLEHSPLSKNIRDTFIEVIHSSKANNQ
ncbi:gamma-glutamyl-gamma-aminobutyrate hydrolase family protein [Ilyomonas limi]|uniref:Gamma-glutamyl-gamma-aminobutyrate hydrolase family protein n=1 Tax=Ilyomonas limi TaxID=2575867 RepID=A0A4U3L2Z9_9BACT|nr:gamma-glutamyl-gamma-aminobutyrate hydrolase family protein [Ilyomonas limi]TKK69418.1 gamma-glutamyl-gamma-aminobutyrate hydrolase family protein [Ilyomonas limi]